MVGWPSRARRRGTFPDAPRVPRVARTMQRCVLASLPGMDDLRRPMNNRGLDNRLGPSEEARAASIPHRRGAGESARRPVWILCSFALGHTALETLGFAGR